MFDKSEEVIYDQFYHLNLKISLEKNGKNKKFSEFSSSRGEGVTFSQKWMSKPKIEDFCENLNPIKEVRIRGEAVYPILQTGNFFKKYGRFVINKLASSKLR